MSSSVGIASVTCCIAAIAGLANQETLRTENILGMAVVSFGLASTTADMSVIAIEAAAFEQTGVLAGNLTSVMMI